MDDDGRELFNGLVKLTKKRGKVHTIKYDAVMSQFDEYAIALLKSISDDLTKRGIDPTYGRVELILLDALFWLRVLGSAITAKRTLESDEGGDVEDASG